ncbi:MAG: LacI family DNA-binding transcriptional regulator [Oscillospiraceae bacterium]
MSIKKIAEIAGVSYSTVSRVLSNPEYKCSDEGVRERILAAARELNYIPNEAAKSLKLGIKKEQNPYKISILVTRTGSAGIDPFFREITRITESEIHKNMCILSQVLYMPELSGERPQVNTGELLSGGSDGLIIIGKCSPAAIKVLKKSFKAVVSLNRNSTNYESDEVICDGAKIAALAVEYLIGLGHRKIGYVGDCHNESRFKGYRETLFKYNLDYDVDFVINTRQGEEQGYEIMERLMQQKNVLTGIYCANDITAVGMLKALSKYKNRYYSPSIISSDDIDEAQFTKPMLTTVRLPKEDMAKFALYLLLDRLNGGHKAAARVELEGTLIIRESCSQVSGALDCEYYI